MTIASQFFIIFFLPVFLFFWFLLNKKHLYMYANILLLVSSCIFYGWVNVRYVYILFGSICMNYLISWIMRKVNKKKSLLIIGLIINIALLGFLKYANFFIQSTNAIFMQNIPLIHLLLPLGISFFTFEQIAFLVDTYKDKEMIYRYSFLEYAIYITYFPIIASGPITIHHQFIPQLRDPGKRAFQWDEFRKGIMFFALGISQKVLLADPLGKLANYGFSGESTSASVAMLSILAYSLQLYFDFAGYSDMATGIAKLMNFDLPQNFSSPYRALGIGEFWKRWHMSLTNFLTRYIYIPLGGNRKGKLRQKLNVMIVFLISGLWHGANWTFVVWGALHGAASIADKGISSKIKKIPRLLRWICTFAAVNIFWVFFRAESLSSAMRMLGSIFSGDFSLPDAFFGSIQPMILSTLKMFVPGISPYMGVITICYGVILLIFALYAAVLMKNSFERVNANKFSSLQAITLSVLMFFALISLTQVGSFIYEGF